MPDMIIPGKCVASFASCSMRWTAPSMSPVGIEGSLRSGQRHPDIQADRRHLPGLQPRHPDRERQAAPHRPRSFEEGVDRVATIASEKDPRGEDVARPRQDHLCLSPAPENGTAAEEVPGDYAAEGLRDRLQRALPARHPGANRGRHGRGALADAAAPTLLRENDKAAALYVLMPMRV
jgi:DNA polymerase-3 subunit beta